MEIPGWLYWDAKKFSAKVLELPRQENFEAKINPQLIVEFYSR